MITRVSCLVCLLCVALVNAKLNRIIGGDIAELGQFRYQVSVHDNSNRLCGGAIIADRYILTAAHCFVDDHGIFYSLRYQVIAGSSDVYSHQGVRIDVEKVYVPSTYKAKSKRSDIAVLRLSTGVGLGSNPFVGQINLPSSREQSVSSYVGYPSVMTGYGYNHLVVKKNPITRQKKEFDGSTDGKLRYAMINIISNEDCTRKNYYMKVLETHICGHAVQREGQHSGICSGDSGGPLVSGNTIIGVAIYSSTGCREDKYAAIYTRVSSFDDFIENAMNDVETNDMMIREIQMGESSRVSGQRSRKSKCHLN